MGEEKGKIELKKILAVEAVDHGCLDGKRNVFQVIHICATRYDPVILYVVTGSTEEQEKWISGIRKCAIKNNATFIKNYHSGVWTGACFTCCHAQGKLARGCKVVHGCVEGISHERAGEDQGKQTSSGISSSSSSIKSRTRTAPSRPPPSIPHNNGESSGARHTEHDSPRSSAKSRLTKKSSSTSQSSSNGRSQINKICVGIYDYSPSSDSDVTIVKGERFEVLDDSDENWWTVKNIKNGESGYAPKNYLEEDAAVDAYEWYFGSVSTSDCDSLMANDGRPGCFLVRDSREKGTFTLCLFDGASIRKFRIENTTTGKVYIVKEKEFSSVPQLIEYYQQHEVGSTGCRLESVVM
ncbi:tyrosine-protein kinase Tec-like [Saccostrea echinata]|uniref:tyrosine-protein kinase Tec-like n=1 Tax=Saccostrea echinata TaxID=191078 RepID=UPI002A814142|nr:tyrosine-protein kinase Tec-like [Saccostrea echinata]